MVNIVTCSHYNRFEELSKIGPCFVLPVSAKVEKYFSLDTFKGTINGILHDVPFDKEPTLVVAYSDFSHTYSSMDYGKRVDATLHLFSEADAVAAKLKLESSLVDHRRGDANPN